MNSTKAVSKAAAALIVIALLIGIGIGYAVGMGAAPAAVTTVTETVTSTTTMGAETVTVTETVATTVTAPGAAAGLQGEVPIGALLTLTGVLSSYGENSKVALELAEEEINAWLEARGEAWRVKIYIEDTATDPKTALDKIMTLHGRGIRFIIGPMTSAEVSEVKSYADANEILVVSQSSTSPALAIPDDWVYRYCPTDVIQGPAAARLAYEQGIRYLVQVWRGDTWGDGLAHATEESFLALLEKEGAEGGVEEGIRYDPAAKEFSAEAAKLAEIVGRMMDQYGADKVGVSYIAFEEAVAFFAAAKAYPVLEQVKWIGSDGTAGLAPLVTEPDAAEFAVKTEFISPIFTAAVSPAMERVKARVQEKLGRTPDTYAYAAYDIAWTLALALEAVDAYDPAAVKAVLPDILKNYYGATGNFELNEDGDRAFADYELWVPWPTDGEYEWKVAGVYHAAIDTIEWADWWLEAH